MCVFEVFNIFFFRYDRYIIGFFCFFKVISLGFSWIDR